MMFTMPVYDMMLLPGVTFYFKNDIFQQMGSQDAKTGDDVLFLMQRSDKDRKRPDSRGFLSPLVFLENWILKTVREISGYGHWQEWMFPIWK